MKILNRLTLLFITLALYFVTAILFWETAFADKPVQYGTAAHAAEMRAAPGLGGVAEWGVERALYGVVEGLAFGYALRQPQYLELRYKLAWQIIATCPTLNETPTVVVADYFAYAKSQLTVARNALNYVVTRCPAQIKLLVETES